MIGLCRIAGGRADAAIGFANQLVRRKGFVGRVAPELLADTFVHQFGKGFGETVSQSFDKDGGIIIIGPLEAFGNGDFLDPGSDDKPADIIVAAAVHRRDEIGKCHIRACHRASTAAGAG